MDVYKSSTDVGLDDKKKPTAEQLEKYRSVRGYNNDWRFERDYDLTPKSLQKMERWG